VALLSSINHLPENPTTAVLTEQRLQTALFERFNQSMHGNIAFSWLVAYVYGKKKYY
jgi:hypothetical protein